MCILEGTIEAATIVSKVSGPPWEGTSSGLTGKPKMARKTSSAPDLEDTRLFSLHDALITPTVRISLKISTAVHGETYSWCNLYYMYRRR